MTELVLVRHGETVWHARNRYAGSSDVPLTPRGTAQAERLAAWAGGAGVDALWCSTLSRARETARPCARATGLTARADARLCELDFGDAEGLTAADMERAFPDRLAAFRADPVAAHLPAGEDPRLAAKRALSCFADIAREWPDGRVLVVAHSTLIRLALCRLLGVPLAEYRRTFPVLGNCARTTLRLLDGDRAALLEFNVAPPAAGPAGDS